MSRAEGVYGDGPGEIGRSMRRLSRSMPCHFHSNGAGVGLEQIRSNLERIATGGTHAFGVTICFNIRCLEHFV